MIMHKPKLMCTKCEVNRCIHVEVISIFVGGIFWVTLYNVLAVFVGVVVCTLALPVPSGGYISCIYDCENKN